MCDQREPCFLQPEGIDGNYRELLNKEQKQLTFWVAPQYSAIIQFPGSKTTSLVEEDCGLVCSLTY